MCICEWDAVLRHFVFPLSIESNKLSPTGWAKQHRCKGWTHQRRRPHFTGRKPFNSICFSLNLIQFNSRALLEWETCVNIAKASEVDNLSLSSLSLSLISLSPSLLPHQRCHKPIFISPPSAIDSQHKNPFIFNGVTVKEKLTPSVTVSDEEMSPWLF